MEEDTSTFYRVDVETTDNFFLSYLVLHLYTIACFVVGTLIDIVGDQGGTREIENIKVGDAYGLIIMNLIKEN